MDGLFHGKLYEQMDDLGGKKPIFGNTHVRKDGNHTIQLPKDDVKGTPYEQWPKLVSKCSTRYLPIFVSLYRFTGISWVWPPPSNSHKWRFSSESPILQMVHNPCGDSYWEGGQPKV